MGPNIQRFGAGGETNLHPLGLVIVGLAVILIFVLPRKYAIAPLLFISFCLPLSQEVVIAGVHLMMMRIILIFGWIRLVFSVVGTSDASSRFRMNTIDKVFVLWALSSAIAFTLLWRDFGALVNRMGFLYNALGIYFLFRFFLRDPEDIDRITKVFAFICVILALFMLNEQFTRLNAFSIFGGVRRWTMVRDGRLRSQGPFGNAILAGCFGAILLPLFLGLWWRHKSRIVAVIGIVAATLMVLASASSTPVLAYVAGVGALFMWPMRKRMRSMRWGVVFALAGLQLVMKAPVWALIARVNVVGGSAGWHRYELVDKFIRNFWDWWLVGTRSPQNWGWFTGDLANHYVDIGANGGIVTLALFFALLTYCFKYLGIARKAVQGSDPLAAKHFWVLGAALFANMAAFMGIAYFDQTQVAWYALLAMISTATFAPGLLPEKEQGLAWSGASASPHYQSHIGAGAKSSMLGWQEYSRGISQSREADLSPSGHGNRSPFDGYR